MSSVSDVLRGSPSWSARCAKLLTLPALRAGETHTCWLLPAQRCTWRTIWGDLRVREPQQCRTVSRLEGRALLKPVKHGTVGEVRLGTDAEGPAPSSAAHGLRAALCLSNVSGPRSFHL